MADAASLRKNSEKEHVHSDQNNMVSRQAMISSLTRLGSGTNEVWGILNNALPLQAAQNEANQLCRQWQVTHNWNPDAPTLPSAQSIYHKGYSIGSSDMGDLHNLSASWDSKVPGKTELHRKDIHKPYHATCICHMEDLLGHMTMSSLLLQTSSPLLQGHHPSCLLSASAQCHLSVEFSHQCSSMELCVLS